MSSDTLEPILPYYDAALSREDVPVGGYLATREKL
jgi:hypothetical protein